MNRESFKGTCAVSTGGRRYFKIVVLALVLVLLTGCMVERTDSAKLGDLSYRVLEEGQIPEPLAERIQEKKAQNFQMTYDSDGYRYIAVGYGAQATGGYSISVEELYETSNAIYVNTNLIGPRKGEATCQAESYPYLVVEIEYLDKSVVFE